jgi:lipid II:glycine glycyltransferase (peptidoglycan interpeptide bridge formation enzyme)
MNNKEKYRKFCLDESEMSIFSKDWWLDAVCGKNNWNVVLVEKGGHIVGALPFFCCQRFVFKGIGMPLLTQTMGPYIKYPPGQKYETKLGYEKEIFNSLIESLPKVDFFLQNFNYRITNWLAFYWKGFEQKTRYTYVLENLNDLDSVWKNFNNKLRTDIRKAERELKVVDSDNCEAFYEINKKTFVRQNLATPYQLEFVKNIDSACMNRGCRKIFLAVDDEQNIQAAIYIVWDQASAYYLMGGSDPRFRNSGATSLLLWHAVKFANTRVSRFDFEGSMHENIERFFRSFGAVQKPYFQISKFNSPLLRVFKILKSLA